MSKDEWKLKKTVSLQALICSYGYRTDYIYVSKTEKYSCEFDAFISD